MNERVWFAALVYPAPLYASLVVLERLWGGSLPMLLGFVVTLGFGTATAVGLVRRPALVAGGRIVLAILAVPILASFGLGDAGYDFSVGILIAASFLWLEYSWRADSTPGARVLALQLTFLLGIVTIASADAADVSSRGIGFYNGLLSVLSGQIQSIASLLVGQSSGSVPLEAALDVPFAALAAVAAAGMLMAWFVPQTALQEPLPWSWARARPASEPAPPAAVEQVLRDGQRQALSSRTLSTPPEAVVAPGFLPVLLAATVVVAFVVLAVELPALALGTLVLGAAAGVVVVGLLLRRRLTSVGGLAG